MCLHKRFMKKKLKKPFEEIEQDSDEVSIGSSEEELWINKNKIVFKKYTKICNNKRFTSCSLNPQKSKS